MAECQCWSGWICEDHPDRPVDHDGCGGAGKRCDNPDCPWWKGPSPAALMNDDGTMLQPRGEPRHTPKKPN
jgi:hypothetical protein